MRSRFWIRWVLANAWAEFIGLGAVASIGGLVASHADRAGRAGTALAVAALFVGLGALEGAVVGIAQQRVLADAVPGLSGWVRATVAGAVVAWAVGMLPSTVISLLPREAGASPPAIGQPLRLLLAAGLGCVAGPILAACQWRRLRHVLPRAWRWLPANALAWAAGMPIIFQAAHVAAAQGGSVGALLVVGSAFFAAGAVVGAIHGLFLAGWMAPANGLRP